MGGYQVFTAGVGVGAGFSDVSGGLQEPWCDRGGVGAVCDLRLRVAL